MSVFLRPVYSNEGRVFGLDLLRCLAIVFVLIDHSLLLLPAFSGRDVIREYAGAIGVEMFFSLSGFLIGSILLRVFTKNAHFSSKDRLRFWSRRWLRTLPAFIFYLLLFTIVALATGYEEFGSPGVASFVQVLFFIQNLVFIHSNYFGISWSLAIEEWFYLLLPVALSIAGSLSRSEKRVIFLRTVLIMIIASFLLRIVVFFFLENGVLPRIAASQGISDFLERFYTGVRKIVALRLDAASYGVIIGFIYFYHRDRLMSIRKPLFLAGLFIVMIAAWFYYSIIEQHFSFTPFVFTFAFLGVGFSMLLPYSIGLESKRFPPLLVKVIQVISIISYSVYLSHSIFLNLLRHWLPEAGWLTSLAAVALMLTITYISSVLSYNYIERRGMQLRKAE
ncbi:MAG: hypothetical protein DI535_21210 [Citrobacter freundii]|nr:MAG: hypothetical protein DI535_21210 [Citrobacter freundii]